ncbi:hypothetical protein PoB_004614200 [Plakobranchus ocellatus]|uniref:Uncharacterized protein n=1 Tax=Plakobranchus ocellatus TaxID=259542 RepID=A0AAV4BL36_9GAST|nr:hypothetical protein PoB_004614200 [Plakobranchus ocellatus]
MTALELIQSFIHDWLMVLIVIIFIAHILDLNAEAKLTPQTLRVCKGVMNIAPWIAATILTVVGILSLRRSKLCFFFSSTKFYILEIPCTIIPTTLTIVLLVVAFVLRKRRFSRGTSTASGNMGVQLLGRGPEIDNTTAYVVAVAVFAICEICNQIYFFDAKNLIYRGVVFDVVSYLLSQSRVVVAVFPWLLLPDIRERIKVWRPWKRQTATGIDLTMTYEKNSSFSDN